MGGAMGVAECIDVVDDTARVCASATLSFYHLDVACRGGHAANARLGALFDE